MCCFTQPVIAVSNTRIFARLGGTGTQFLAYQMNYESSEPNAMILPLPVKQPSDEQSLKFIELNDYQTLFDDLDAGFPCQRPSPGIGCSGGPDAASLSDFLEVFEVGNYIASFVASIEDFGRLDPLFTLPDEVWEKIPGYENFGFAVFQLAAGSLRPHPMALEFRTESNEIFFPTVHIHDGEVHELEKFDHVLYTQHAGLDSISHEYKNSDVEDEATGFVRSKYNAARFCSAARSKGLVHGNLLVHRKILRGKLPNKDTTFTFPGDPTNRSFNFRSLRPYSPWLVMLTAIGWFFNRRSKLRKKSNPAEEATET